MNTKSAGVALLLIMLAGILCSPFVGIKLAKADNQYSSADDANSDPTTTIYGERNFTYSFHFDDNNTIYYDNSSQIVAVAGNYFPINIPQRDEQNLEYEIFTSPNPTTILPTSKNLVIFFDGGTIYNDGSIGLDWLTTPTNYTLNDPDCTKQLDVYLDVLGNLYAKGYDVICPESNPNLSVLDGTLYEMPQPIYQPTDAWIQQLVEYCHDSLGYQNVYLIGQSAGGLLAGSEILKPYAASEIQGAVISSSPLNTTTQSPSNGDMSDITEFCSAEYSNTDEVPITMLYGLLDQKSIQQGVIDYYNNLPDNISKAIYGLETPHRTFLDSSDVTHYISERFNCNDTSYLPPLYFSNIDFDHDEKIDFQDLVYFVNAYINFNQYGILDPACDLNHDGAINFGDLVIFTNYWIAYYSLK
jgi:hypothetical protein